MNKANAIIRIYGWLITLLLLATSGSSFAQIERITNWNFSSGIGSTEPFADGFAWNEFDFDKTELKKTDTEASNGRSLRCIRNKYFEGKDHYGIGQYGGRAQSIIPCPEPGTLYAFSARARVSGPLEGEDPGEVALVFYNDQEEITSQPIFYFTNTSYETQEQIITVPDDAVWCRVWVRKTESVDFLADWVSLKAMVDDTPMDVTGFTATDIGATKVHLEWTPVAGASGYMIERKLPSDTVWYTAFKTLEGGTSSSFLDSRDTKNGQLEPGIEYYYRISALGDYGNSGTTEISVTTATFTSSPGNTTYFIDATNGDDAAAGTSKTTAWKGFMNLDRLALAPGDSVLLMRGEYWDESLILHGSGEAGNEIIIAPYGTEPERPIINVEGKAHAAIRLLDVSYYRFLDLELSNYHPQFREFGKFAIEAGTWQDSSVTSLHFNKLFINKVRGAAVRHGNGGFISDGELSAGIRLATDIRGSDPTDKQIYTASITNCLIQDVEQHSMHLGGIDGITVTNNRVERGGYTNMLTRRLYNGIIANNYFIEGGYYMSMADNAGVGYYGGDNILFEHNVVYKTWNKASGQSLNMDGCDNWIVQYNFFKDSGSGCFVINHGAEGNIFRYNISEGFNDQWFRNLGGVNTTIYNNTAYIYATNTSNKGFFVSNSRTVSKDPKPSVNTQVYNNIFIREVSDSIETANLIYEDPATVSSKFSNNVFYGNFSDLIEEDSNAFFMDPLFVNPGSGTVGSTFDADGYKLQDTSPYIRSGLVIPDNGGIDFWGNELFDAYPPSLGAHQSPIVTAIEENKLPTARLKQNYPNPFNTITNIEYYVPEKGREQKVVLNILDMQGRVVKTLVNEHQSAGHHTVQWNSIDGRGNANTLGIYFYKLRVGDFVETKKMILSY
ncbi:MAG: T9SS type A sorting domain-containing protein [Bacteroidota bacterium]